MGWFGGVMGLALRSLALLEMSMVAEGRHHECAGQLNIDDQVLDKERARDIIHLGLSYTQLL